MVNTIQKCNCLCIGAVHKARHARRGVGGREVHAFVTHCLKAKVKQTISVTEGEGGHKISKFA